MRINLLPRVKIQDGAIIVSNIPFVDECLAIDYQSLKIYATGLFGGEYSILSKDGFVYVGTTRVDYLWITFWFPCLSFSLCNGPHFAIGWIRRDDGSYRLGMAWA